VINGALEHLDGAGIAISEDTLMMRPFPHTASGKPASKGRWTKYRKAMIEEAGIALFVFGNKTDTSGKTVESAGMKEEFDLCVSSGVVPIPVGATGYMAKTLWDDVEARFDHFFPNAPTAIRRSFEAIGKASITPTKLQDNIRTIINHLQKD
jgi:hypothetical protein